MSEEPEPADLADERPDVFQFISFMNVIANETEDFTRSATSDEPPDVNDYCWIKEELLCGDNSGIQSKFVDTLQIMFDAWSVWNVPADQIAPHFAKAKAAYDQLRAEESALWDEHTRRLEERFSPSVNDIADLFEALSNGPKRLIKLLVGAYGRSDMFYLKEGLGDEQRTLADLCADDDETIAALQFLDRAVKTDDHTIFRDTVWFQISEGKTFDDRRQLSAPLYERRKAEQELILSGKLKKGHKAFGFNPLDGGK